MAIQRIFLIRHGETDWNREGRFQGHIDVPLNETGRNQIRALLANLTHHGLGAVLTSDLSRASESGQIIAQHFGIPHHERQDLREAYLGQAQGLTNEEILARFPPTVVQGWRSYAMTDADVRFPGGESGLEIMNRVFGTLTEFLIQHGTEAIAVATHGGVIRRVFQRLAPPNTPPVPIPNGVVYEVHFDSTSGLWVAAPETLIRIQNRA